MFDVAFSEIVVITVVALVVIGPEKLPKVARTLGALTGRLQRYVGNVRSEIEREIQFEELQKLQNELKARADAKVADIEQSMQEVKAQVETDAHSALEVVEEAVEPPSLPIEAAPQPTAEQAALPSAENAVTATNKVAPPVVESHPQLDLGLEAKPQPKPSILE